MGRIMACFIIVLSTLYSQAIEPVSIQGLAKFPMLTYIYVSVTWWSHTHPLLLTFNGAYQPRFDYGDNS